MVLLLMRLISYFDFDSLLKSISIVKKIKGASGAGKTTLLNVLNFRNRGNLKISANVKVNGIEVESREEISSISGYVQQEDLFIPTLKVKEQLKFQVYTLY
jgi:ABC-type multidrug transport system ATPase subunit